MMYIPVPQNLLSDFVSAGLRDGVTPQEQQRHQQKQHRGRRHEQAEGLANAVRLLALPCLVATKPATEPTQGRPARSVKTSPRHTKVLEQITLISFTK